MKIKLLFSFVMTLSPLAQADQWCDVIELKSKAVLQTYMGACDQKRFGGELGDSKLTMHRTNTTKEAELAAAAAAEAVKAKAKSDRLERLKTACVGQTGMLKDLCDQAIEGGP